MHGPINISFMIVFPHGIGAHGEKVFKETRLPRGTEYLLTHVHVSISRPVISFIFAFELFVTSSL